MKLRRKRIVLVSLISFVLLYYSVAWAVLSCIHIESSDDYAVTLDTNGHLSDSDVSFSRTVEPHLDCLGADYHIESLAGPSSPPQFDRWGAYTTCHVSDFLNSSGGYANSAPDLWLKADLDKFSAPTFVPNSPRYLSLASLRI